MSIYSSYESYRKAWRDAESITPPIPLNVDLELYSGCNLKCPFCFITDPTFKSNVKPKFMSFQMAKKIIDQADEIGVPALKFNWRGESTLHPFFTPIIDYAYNKQSFHDLIVNTNGNCHTKSIDGLLLCSKVIVSIDSMVDETYKKSRISGSLEKAKTTINSLVDHGHKNILVRKVITKINNDEAFDELVKAEWGDKVTVSNHFCFDRNEEIENESGLSGFKSSRRYCAYPSQRLIVSSSGDIFPCCVDYLETMPLGNINNNSILQVWNGEDIKYIREDLKNNKFRSKACKNCTSWSAYDAPQRSYLEK